MSTEIEEINDPEELTEEELFEEKYEKEIEEGKRTFFATKWTADGAENLETAALRHEELARGLRDYHQKGWIIENGPVDNGHFEIISPDIQES